MAYTWPKTRVQYHPLQYSSISLICKSTPFKFKKSRKRQLTFPVSQRSKQPPSHNPGTPSPRSLVAILTPGINTHVNKEPAFHLISKSMTNSPSSPDFSNSPPHHTTTTTQTQNGPRPLLPKRRHPLPLHNIPHQIHRLLHNPRLPPHKRRPLPPLRPPHNLLQQRQLRRRTPPILR